jgi:hypothetical protein
MNGNLGHSFHLPHVPNDIEPDRLNPETAQKKQSSQNKPTKVLKDFLEFLHPTIELTFRGTKRKQKRVYDLPGSHTRYKITL